MAFGWFTRENNIGRSRQAEVSLPDVGPAQTTFTGALPPAPQVDVGSYSPDAQFEYLVSMIQADDDSAPAPYTNTPPWGEPILTEEYIPDSVQSEEYLVAPDAQGDITDDTLGSVMYDADGPMVPEWDWYNDQQLYGLAVPPGYPAYAQPIESGRTQIMLPLRTEELGWDAWSGKPALARVPFHTNDFPTYNASQSRGHGVVPIKLYQPYYLVTNMLRQQLLTELNKRGLHSVVVADVPSVPYTEEVLQVDPYALTPQGPIGPEGVLP